MAVEPHPCSMCGQELAGTQWIRFNRYVLASDGFVTMSEAVITPDDGGPSEYVWEPCDDPDGPVGESTGSSLCWPGCASLWIEAKMVAVAAIGRQNRDSE